ncbi:CopG family transcriptional regulator [Streptomyces sp. JJ66]|uniref:CopG family transcriptional regulator n=1 Tax=Streptomyces sp. JJ66 TaxID=2803843 RepID=UPI001C575715|nr:CopG family transcriptional regulator [Streptomyces sp. JJ66]MBW1602341.1 CopG family transcriptional regulator [Streptomyces sp. JJ66]
MGDVIKKYSISMPEGVAEAARTRAGSAGLSAYVAAAVARQLERDNLDELIAAGEAEHGPITEEDIRRKAEILRRAVEEQGGGSQEACAA